MTWHPDMPQEYRNQIVTGDARELAKAIPDESVDLIFTDPVYQNIDDYRWLAAAAARVLKPGGNLIAQTCSFYRYACEQAMIPFLAPQPLLCEQLTSPAAMYKYRTSQMWKPYLWFAKGKRAGGWVLDAYRGGGVSKKTHEWGDSEAFFAEYTFRLADRGMAILDPFTGGATVPAVCKMLDRNYIAFEIDPATADLARERVANTQPPLFVPEPEQLEMAYV